MRFFKNSFHSFPPRNSAGRVVVLTFVASLLAGCASYGPPKPVAGASLKVSENSLNFKDVVVGQTATQALHLSNSGTAALQLSKLTLSDPQFVITGPSVPRAILPNMGLDYTLSFTPKAAGSATAALTIASNALNPTASVSLAGVGEKVVTTIEVSPVSLNFGNLNLQTTASKTVTVQNTGDVNITVSGITVAGSGFGFSDLAPGFSLAPSQSVTFQVWFKPQVKGPASGTVSIISANLASPASLSLAGDGVTATTTPPPAQHTVQLSWDSSSSPVVGYYVYRSQSSASGFQKVDSSAIAATDYSDASVASGTTYYYAVTAVNASGEESPYSNLATAVVP